MPGINRRGFFNHLQSVKPGDRARFLELSNERAKWLDRVYASWREGFLAGAQSRADDYERGFVDGLLAFKRIQHEVVGEVQEVLADGANLDLWRHRDLELLRWDGRREDFGKPRPGEYEGGPVVPW